MQTLGNRPGNETVGGGDDHQFVAGIAVLFQQGQGLGQDDRFDAIAHEIGMPFVELGHFGVGQNLQGEFQVGIEVQLAGQVVLVELVVTVLVGHRVENAALAQVVAPRVVAVATEEGIVQIE
ncbi:hypothetical protein D3C72_2127950 [compost metagenome]